MKNVLWVMTLLMVGACNQASFQGNKKGDDPKASNDADATKLEDSDETASVPGNITGASLACVVTKAPTEQAPSSQVGCRLSNDKTFAKESGYTWNYNLAVATGLKVVVTETPSDPSYNVRYDISGTDPNAQPRDVAALCANAALNMEVLAQKPGATSYQTPVNDVQVQQADIDAIIVKENQVKTSGPVDDVPPPQ